MREKDIPLLEYVFNNFILQTTMVCTYLALCPSEPLRQLVKVCLGLGNNKDIYVHFNMYFLCATQANLRHQSLPRKV